MSQAFIFSLYYRCLLKLKSKYLLGYICILVCLSRFVLSARFFFFVRRAKYYETGLQRGAQRFPKLQQQFQGCLAWVWLGQKRGENASRPLHGKQHYNGDCLGLNTHTHGSIYIGSSKTLGHCNDQEDASLIVANSSTSHLVSWGLQKKQLLRAGAVSLGLEQLLLAQARSWCASQGLELVMLAWGTASLGIKLPEDMLECK